MSPAYAGQRLEPARASALDHLHTTIQAALDAGAVIPCCGPDGGDWIAEDADTQQRASAACYSCPLMTAACETYITAYPEPAGVWSGLTPNERNS